MLVYALLIVVGLFACTCQIALASMTVQVYTGKSSVLCLYHSMCL